MWRPGQIGMMTDHNPTFDDRLITALVGFHVLKSPTTDTRRARALSKTNCWRIGFDSSSLDAAVCNVAVGAAGPAATDAATGVRSSLVRHCPRATNPTTAAAAAIPIALHMRIDRPRAARSTNTGSSAGLRRAAAA